jgi:uncharacterized membrane protein YraQ (UPF0718 family)
MHKTDNRTHKWILLITVILILLFLTIFPATFSDLIKNNNYAPLLIVIIHLPAFFLLMGMLEVSLPEKKVVELLGKKSGVKGSVFAFLLGAIMPGPIYLAFPIAGSLLRKNISVFNAALFVGAWSSFKIGEEIFELEFLGLQFMLLRILLVIPFVIISAFILSRAHLKEEIIRKTKFILNNKEQK